MFIEGNKYGVGFWYVCWGAPPQYNMSIYRTLNGLAKWFVGIGKEVPVYRVGRVVFTETGLTERDQWNSREDFIAWAKGLVPFALP